MKEMELLECIEPQNLSEPVGMENGNTKTGECGKVYDKIFVWNLPPVITCPGLSEWCKFNCYNADNRYDKFPIDKWCENLWWVLNKKEVLSNKIQLQLDEYRLQKVAVRIHSSGDFFSKEYIEFWKKIIERNPWVDFWAYTRSWCVEENESGAEYKFISENEIKQLYESGKLVNLDFNYGNYYGMDKEELLKELEMEIFTKRKKN